IRNTPKELSQRFARASTRSETYSQSRRNWSLSWAGFRTPATSARSSGLANLLARTVVSPCAEQPVFTTAKSYAQAQAAYFVFPISDLKPWMKPSRSYAPGELSSSAPRPVQQTQSNNGIGASLLQY